MRPINRPLIRLHLLSIIVLVALLPLSLHAQWKSNHSFTLHFDFKVMVPKSQRSNHLRLWIPIPSSDLDQSINNIAIQSPFKYEMTQERVYGNRMAYFNVSAVKPGTYPFKVIYNVWRTEITTEYDTSKTDKSDSTSKKRHPTRRSSKAIKAIYARFLKNQKLTYFDDMIRAQAETAIAHRTSPQQQLSIIEKGEALYRFVLSKMEYNKSGKGWGRGSTAHACTVGQGNCTDFHSYFNSLSRSIGIPSRFQIGYALPVKGGQFAGYHCWAEFYSPITGWIPVDISEADKHPEKASYYFGNLDFFRIRLSEGREFNLEPRQSGKPLNFFYIPYVELNETTHPIIERNSWITDSKIN